MAVEGLFPIAGKQRRFVTTPQSLAELGCRGVAKQEGPWHCKEEQGCSAGERDGKGRIFQGQL